MTAGDERNWGCELTGPRVACVDALLASGASSDDRSVANPLCDLDVQERSSVRCPISAPTDGTRAISRDPVGGAGVRAECPALWGPPVLVDR